MSTNFCPLPTGAMPKPSGMPSKVAVELCPLLISGTMIALATPLKRHRVSSDSDDLAAPEVDAGMRDHQGRRRQ